jgi:predicted nucleic acid-binding protein
LAFIRNYPVIAITEDLALYAADLSAIHQLAMADALIYATALANNATLWTQDVDFKGLPNVRYFTKTKL